MISSNHLRQNILTDQWVIYSPQRGNRPQSAEVHKKKKSKELPEKDDGCPFCPGNEEMLPEILYEVEAKNKSGWINRIVPNKFAALSSDEEIKGGNHGIYLTTSAYGVHEVIIETPAHNRDLPDMSLGEINKVIESYVNRYKHILDEHDDILNIIIFRNHGAGSGTSLIHPHSQLIGTAIVPKYIHDKQELAEKYRADKGKCIMCDMFKYEKHDEKRVIYENSSFLGIVPFAAEVPYEIWLIPQKHRADFSEVNAAEMGDLATGLRDVLTMLEKLLGDTDYNYIIHSCTRQKSDSEALHWYLQIRPRTSIAAGFEIGSGIHINSSIPEKDAQALREM